MTQAENKKSEKKKKKKIILIKIIINIGALPKEKSPSSTSAIIKMENY